MKIRILTVAFLWIASLSAFAQDKPELTLFEKSHDFGTIEETDGPVDHTFYFVNSGKDSLTISSVKASCGCTTPAWSTDPVAPADTGFITARYNPTNRPGKFSKSLTIYSNASKPLQVLSISGMVNPRPRTPAEDYPTKNGVLRSKYRAFYMGTVTTRGPVTKEFDLYNDGQDTLIFQPNTVVPEHIQLAFMPDTLAPATKGKLIITYDGAKQGGFGYQADNILFFTNEQEEPGKSYSLMATIQEYFPPMTKDELRQAPKVAISARTVDFGRMMEGDTLSRVMTLTNSGLTPLEIRQIQPNCGCLKAETKLTRVLPGESVPVTLSFYSEGRRGPQQKSVTVFTNDPRNPTQSITIKAEVEPRPEPKVAPEEESDQ